MTNPGSGWPAASATRKPRPGRNRLKIHSPASIGSAAFYCRFSSFSGAQPVLGWTKPLEINPENLRRPRRDGLLIAASGPAANLLLALAGIGTHLGLKAAGFSLPPMVLQILISFCRINACLAVFNLLPIPPLAGAAAAELFLDGDALSAFEDIKPYGFVLLLAGAFFNFFDFLTMPVTRLIFVDSGILK